MSVLRTRVAGFLFEIRTYADGRAVGMFLAEKENNERTTFMDLPFDLRSTFAQESGQTLPILMAAENAVVSFLNETNSHYSFCEKGSTCEDCTIFDATIDRCYTTLRGNYFLASSRREDLHSDRFRRVVAQVKDCGICDAGTLHCDEHSMRLALTR